MAGVVLTNMITSKIGIQPEFLYSGQGGKITSQGFTEHDKFAYLNIPVLLRWQVIPQFNLHIGPQLGVLLSAKEDDGSGYQNIKDQLKSTDFGLAIGAGVDLPGGLNVGVRFIAGLSNINADTASATVKNSVIQFSIGVEFQRDSLAAIV